MEGYYFPGAGRLVLFGSQVTGRHAGGKLMVIVLKHLAKLSHVEHPTTEGTTLEMARVCDWNIRHASANPSKAILPPLPVHFLTTIACANQGRRAHDFVGHGANRGSARPTPVSTNGPRLARVLRKCPSARCVPEKVVTVGDSGPSRKGFRPASVGVMQAGPAGGVYARGLPAQTYERPPDRQVAALYRSGRTEGRYQRFTQKGPPRVMKRRTESRQCTLLNATKKGAVPFAMEPPSRRPIRQGRRMGQNARPGGLGQRSSCACGLNADERRRVAEVFGC
jgi:hypothetical protein